ncbi:MAG: hypothetical protein AAFS02_04725 [Pseudomonadota bacterium]
MITIRSIALGVILALVAGCTPPDNAEYHVPENTGDGWDTASLEARNIEPSSIQEMLARIHDGDYAGVSSVLLARNGALVLEAYFGKWDRDEQPLRHGAAI